MKDANDRLQAGLDLPTQGRPITLAAPDAATPLPVAEENDPLAGLAVGDLAKGLHDQLWRRADKTERPLATPWADLNKVLRGGLWPGLHMVCGGTGTGKSQFALQLGLHAAEKHGAAVYYAALELGQLDLYARLLGLVDEVGGRQWSEIYRGAAQKDLPISVPPRLMELPLYLAQGKPHGWDYGEIGVAAAALRKRHPDAPLMLVIDFIQLVSSPLGAREDMRERISRAGYEARDVARRYGATVLMLSSVAREHYGRINGTDAKGTIEEKYTQKTAAALVGLGKESGDLEFSADTVLTMSREWDEKSSEVEFHVALAKQRAGQTGWAHLRFDGTRFLGREHP